MANSTKFSAEISEELLNKWNYQLAWENFPATFVLALYLVVGVIGNSAVLYVYATKFKTELEDRYFIPWLAVFDLAACIVSCSFSIYINERHVQFDSDATCKLLWFLGMTTVGMASYMLLIIAVQRYQKICRPAGYQMSMKWKKMSVVILSIVCVVVSLPCFVFFGSKEVKNPDLHVTGWKCTSVSGNVPRIAIAYKGTLFVLIFLELIVLSVLYALIAKTILQHVKLEKSRLSSAFNNNFTKKEGCEKYHQTSEFIDYTNARSEDISGSTIASVEIATVTQPHHKGVLVEENNVYRQNIKTAEDRNQIRRIPGTRMSVMFIVIAVVFIISFLPKLTMMVLESLEDDFWRKFSSSGVGWLRVLYTLNIVNNVVNPFIYGLMDHRFRSELKALFCGRFQK